MKNKILYALPTMKCNLHCPHCFIKDTPETFDREKFLSVLNNFEGSIVMFGGEVTSNLDRFYDIYESNMIDGKSKISSVSSNLIVLNDKLISIYKSINSVSTSWNALRFTNAQYELWKSNCKRLSCNGIRHRIMVTLTEDLLEWDVEAFLDKAKEWITTTLRDIKFEHYVGDSTSPEYFERVDKWLCELYSKWNIATKMEISERVLNWSYDCSEIYTLYPDGTVKNECPHASARYTPIECFECSRVETCRPCRLQKYCSYPKRFAELVKADNKHLEVDHESCI